MLTFWDPLIAPCIPLHCLGLPDIHPTQCRASQFSQHPISLPPLLSLWIFARAPQAPPRAAQSKGWCCTVQLMGRASCCSCWFCFALLCSSVQNQVDEVIDVMQENITKVIERGERLDDLQDKSGVMINALLSLSFSLHLFPTAGPGYLI